MVAYYNEIDPFAAQWLRNLIAAGHIAPGDVDERDIRDVRPSDLRGYTQCHFFAGIGVWSYAARAAGWPDARPLWTGSCPCQPFSTAGRGAGFADERHLWPHWFWLIEQCRPVAVLGEQVASKDGLAWLDLVLSDLEGAGYAAGAVDLCAAGVGAPHIRQRLWWVADAAHGGWREQRNVLVAREGGHADGGGDAFGVVGLPDDDGLEGRQRVELHGDSPGRLQPALGPDRARAGGMADTDGRDASTERVQRGREQRQQPSNSGVFGGEPAAGPTNGLWRDADWLLCRDGRWRPVEPGTFPLAHGAPARVGRLRAYGNAIVAQAAEEFIAAYLDAEAGL